MIATLIEDPDLCRVCMRHIATADGLCEGCRPLFRTDEPTWNTTKTTADPGGKKGSNHE